MNDLTSVHPFWVSSQSPLLLHWPFKRCFTSCFSNKQLQSSADISFEPLADISWPQCCILQINRRPLVSGLPVFLSGLSLLGAFVCESSSQLLVGCGLQETWVTILLHEGVDFILCQAEAGQSRLLQVLLSDISGFMVNVNLGKRTGECWI